MRYCCGYIHLSVLPLRQFCFVESESTFREALLAEQIEKTKRCQTEANGNEDDTKETVGGQFDADFDIGFVCS
jgi:hypothetical protein